MDAAGQEQLAVSSVTYAELAAGGRTREAVHGEFLIRLRNWQFPDPGESEPVSYPVVFQNTVGVRPCHFEVRAGSRPE